MMINFPGDAMTRVLDFLGKRDFPAAALIDRQWRKAVQDKARRHTLKPGTILWSREYDYPDPSNPASYGTRIVVNSNATHVTTMCIGNRWVESWEPRPVFTCMGYGYRVTVAPDLEALRQFANIGHPHEVLWPHAGDRADFMARINLQPTQEQVILGNFTRMPGDDDEPSMQSEHMWTQIHHCRANKILIADPELSCAQIQIAASIFANSRPHLNCQVVTTAQHLHKTLHALRIIDHKWHTRPVLPLWYTLCETCGPWQEGAHCLKIVEQVRAEEPEPRAMRYVRRCVCTAVPDERPWGDDTATRRVKVRRTQKLAWYTCFVDSAFHPGGMTAPTTRLPRT
jgi:hypothetical protein